MKKILLTISLVLGAATLMSGQTTKGRVMMSGSTNMSLLTGSSKLVYDGKKMDSGSMTNFEFTPQVSYFFIDNLAVGLGIELTVEDNDGTNTTSIMVGPTARYYFGGEKLKPFADAALAFGTSKTDENKFGAFGTKLQGGIAYFFNDHVAFDAAMGYQYMQATHDDDSKLKIKNNSFALNLGISILF